MQCTTLVVRYTVAKTFEVSRFDLKSQPLKSSVAKIMENLPMMLDDIFYEKILSYFKKAKVNFPPERIILLAFKSEKRFEVWIQNANEEKKLLKSYQVTADSGTLGPKLKEGDKQIPEGIYKIEYLNPDSKYHLSLKINYPNNFDIAKCLSDGRKQTELGSDIFIHGGCKSVGCVAIGNEAIEEVFALISKFVEAVEDGISKIKVIISPNDLRVKKAPCVDDFAFDWIDELYENIKNELESL